MGAASYSMRFIHFNEKKAWVSETIEHLTGLHSTVEGNVRLNLLPPALVLEKVNFSDALNKSVLYAQEVMLRVKLFELITGNKEFSIEGISIFNGGFNPQSIISHMRNANISKDVHITSVSFRECYFFEEGDKGKRIQYKAVQEFNGEIHYDSLLQSKDLVISTNLKINDINYDLNGSFQGIDNAGSGSKAVINLANDAISFNFEGSLNNIFSAPELVGQISSQVSNLTTIKQFVNDDGFLGSFFKDNQIAFKSDLSANNKFISITNATINSRDIQNLQGSIEVDFTYGSEITANLAMDALNLNKLSTPLDLRQEERASLLKNLISKIINGFDFKVGRDLSAIINLSIKKINLNNDVVTDFNSSFDLFDGNMLINTIEAKLPGSGVVSLNGQVSNNGIRPKLEGELEIQINDLPTFANWATIGDSVISKRKSLIAAMGIELIPNRIMLGDIKIKAEDIELVGKIIAHDDINADLSFDSFLRLRQLNLDDFQIADRVDELFYNLFISDFDKTGEKFSEFTKDLRWLRTWKNNINLELLIDRAIFKKQTVDNASLSISIANNSLIINNISVDSDDVAFHGHLNMTMPVFRPYISGKITFDHLNIDKMAFVLPNIEVYRKAYSDFLTQKFAATPAKDSTEEQYRKNELELLTYQYNFLGAVNYDADFNIKADNIVSQSNLIHSVSCDVKLLNGVINVKNLTSRALNGDIQANANISVVTHIPNFNIAFAMINVDPGSVYKIATGYDKKIPGYLSSSGQLSFRGSNKSALYENLSGSLDLYARQTGWNGFDLNKVIESVESSWGLEDKIKAIKYYTQYGDTLFDSVKGAITINSGLVSFDNIILQNDRISGAVSARCYANSKLCNAAARYAFIPSGTNDQVLLTMQSKGEVGQLKTDADYDTLQKYLQSHIARRDVDIADNSIASILRSRRGG